MCAPWADTQVRPYRGLKGMALQGRFANRPYGPRTSP